MSVETKMAELIQTIHLLESKLNVAHENCKDTEERLARLQEQYKSLCDHSANKSTVTGMLYEQAVTQLADLVDAVKGWCATGSAFGPEASRMILAKDEADKWLCCQDASALEKARDELKACRQALAEKEKQLEKGWQTVFEKEIQRIYWINRLHDRTNELARLRESLRSLKIRDRQAAAANQDFQDSLEAILREVED